MSKKAERATERRVMASESLVWPYKNTGKEKSMERPFFVSHSGC